jgi:ATP-binding cassette subfamily B multidrug efflux pump
MAEYDLDLEDDIEERPFDREHFLRILNYAVPYKKTALFAGLLTLLGIVIGLVEPLLLRTAVDGATKLGDMNLVIKITLTLLFLRVLLLFTQKIQIRMSNFLGQRILYDLRQELFEHVEHLPFSFFDHRPAGKIISRLTNDVNHMGNLASSVVISTVSQLISLVGIIIIMISMDWMMSLLCFSTLPLLIFVMTKVRWALQSAWSDSRKAVGEINAHLNETIQGLQVIQAFGREYTNSTKFSGSNRKYFGSHMRATKLDSAFWPLTDLVGAIGMCVVIWYGAVQASKGLMSLGTIVAFTQYVSKFWAPISTFSRVWSQVLSAMASAERVFGILDLAVEEDDSSKMLVLPRLDGKVVFDNVSFGYKDGQTVLKNISFTINPGETIALVGPTGAGKTTIINLLARFYTPSSGKILVDGYDLQEVDLASYRKQLGIVLQDTFIFSGTIMDNLKFGKLDATLEEIERAVETVYAKRFIQKMPGAYDAVVKERGSNLSSGQRQLLAFARAILANPRILILDEATSSIDPETEQLIQKAMKTLLEGRTSFIIAHRLSTVRSADRIMVIEDGEIVEDGPHEKLITTGGLYSQLYSAQFRSL